jgi:hypothetical protein
MTEKTLKKNDREGEEVPSLSDLNQSGCRVCVWCGAYGKARKNTPLGSRRMAARDPSGVAKTKNTPRRLFNEHMDEE